MANNDNVINSPARCMAKTRDESVNKEIQCKVKEKEEKKRRNSKLRVKEILNHVFLTTSSTSQKDDNEDEKEVSASESTISSTFLGKKHQSWREQRKNKIAGDETVEKEDSDKNSSEDGDSDTAMNSDSSGSASMVDHTSNEDIGSNGSIVSMESDESLQKKDVYISKKYNNQEKCVTPEKDKKEKKPWHQKR